MTLKLYNLVFRPKISKPLGREKFFELQVGREEKSLGTYALWYMLAIGEWSQQRLLGGPKGSGMQIAARKQSELCLFSVVKVH